MKKIIITSLISLIVFSAYGQYKIMDEEVYDIWNSIKDVNISTNGDWVSYNINPFKGDKSLKLYNTRTRNTIHFERSENSQIDYGSEFICFSISAHSDSITALKRKKIKKENFPLDTLGFFDFRMKKEIKIPNVESFKLPEERAGYLAYLYDSKNGMEEDSVSKEKSKILVIRDFEQLREDTILDVQDFLWSKDGKYLSAYTESKDSLSINSIVIFSNKDKRKHTIWDSNQKADKFSFSENGNYLSFVSYPDSTDNQQYKASLHLWKPDTDASVLLLSDGNDFLDSLWHVSKHTGPQFSKDDKYLYFGIAPELVEQDTNLLEEEIVNVEVWSYTDQILHTEQNAKLKTEKEKSYIQVFDLINQNFIRLATKELPDVHIAKEHASSVILTDFRKYRKSFSWEGINFKDAAVVDLKNGEIKLFAKKEEGNFKISPHGKYAYWYSRPDTCWKSYDIVNDKTQLLTNNKMGVFYDELNDRPMLPESYGIASWYGRDSMIIINDRYDLWMINPSKPLSGNRLTAGREKKIRYRYIKLDKDENSISANSRILLHSFNENNMSSGYVWLDLKNGNVESMISGNMYYSPKIYKAKHTKDIVFTKEDFRTFPDLNHTNFTFINPYIFTNANPQQDDYRWGTSELIEWKDINGMEHKGLLFKPDGFDASSKYPLMVNFYEKSSDRLHRHRSPYAHRSTINYSFYVNRGYLIFNPDVHYLNGYPGQSCYNSVMSGIDKVVESGYIDEERIGVQGHSWGGYQIAHLITKTDRFKCAESGAPVVNMFSAYGGIRWASGLSRMFQYEKSQSRIGATIWEEPELYWENSPLFNLDKVNTPVLILHNDKDGAVPWYQGIEFFVAMRRLNKPAWLLNYNEEPHWPVKRQNRLDLNKRMQQFFDHYLLDAPMPKWMKSGVPAIEKGIKQGFELGQ